MCQIFDDPNDSHWAFTTLLEEAVNEHAPMKTRKLRRNQAPAMNKTWRQAINYRTALQTKYRKNPTDENFENFRKQRNLCVSLRRRSLCGYFRENCKDGSKSKSFWPTIKPYLSKKSRTADMIVLKEGDTLIEDPRKVADTFNDYYLHVADNAPAVNLENHESVNLIKSKHSGASFDFQKVNPTIVKKHIESLNVNKASGCDEIPAKLLKPYASILAPELCIVINSFISNDCFPDDLKHANVSPLFKKEDNLMKSNYRPVSILPAMSKIYESILNEQLRAFFEDIFDVHISAYRKAHSCQSVLLKLIENWREALDQSHFVGAILMDLSKAFDSMPHDLIICKLKAYGLTDRASNLMANYLKNRKQRIRIGSHYSTWCEIFKGVPQGSILGPLLFNIFMNDIYYVLSLDSKSDLYNFADDNTLDVRDKDPVALKLKLEALATQATGYFTSNGLLANADKYQAIFLGPRSNSVSSFNIGSTEIEVEEHVKLLGVYIDNQLNFDKHISELCSKVANQVNVLKRLSPYLDFSSRMTIFQSFILSNFNYCPIIWHSCTVKSANRLERLQGRALRFVYRDYTSSYEDLLRRADLGTLHSRRLKAIALEVYKIINGIGAGYNRDLFIKNVNNLQLRSKGNLVVPKVKSVKNGLRSLKYLGVYIWNQLPIDMKKNLNFNDFKTLLAKWTPDKCRCAYCDSVNFINA